MNLLLTRNRKTDDATFGTLQIENVFECYTMERNTVIIPEGIYSIEFTFSPHFHRLMPLLDGVPERSDIRIHPANWPTQLEGCIAVGTAEEPDALDYSDKAFEALWDKIKDQTDLKISILSQFS